MGITIKTKSPVYHIGTCKSEYLNGDGDPEYGPVAPKTVSGPLPGLGGPGYTQQPSKPQKKKVDINKGIEKVSKGVKDTAGIVDSLKDIFSGGGRGDASSPKIPSNKPAPKETGMTTTTKVVVGVVVLAVIVAAVVAFSKKGK